MENPCGNRPRLQLSESQPFADRDSRTASNPHQRFEERVANRLLRFVVKRGGAVLGLIAAEINNVCGEFGIVIAEILFLRAVVPIDLGLDRRGRRHRHAGPDQSGHGAEREPGDGPHRAKQCRPHTPFAKEPVEGLQMPRLLPRHVSDQVRVRMAPAHCGKLPCIDARRAIFARLIDPHHSRGIGAGIARQPGGARTGHRPRASICSAPMPIAVDAIAFHPAIEMPSIAQAAASQRIIGAAIIAAMKSPPPTCA